MKFFDLVTPKSFRRLLVHGLVYGALLVAVAPLLHLRGVWTTDEGAYHLQVEALDRGTWGIADPAKEVNDTGDWFPFSNSDRAGDTWFPYVKFPAWPKVLQGGNALFGDVAGFQMFTIAGACLGVLGAGVLTELLKRGRGVIGLWLAACSSITFHAFVIWAHAPAMALATWACVAAVYLLKRRDLSRAPRLALYVACSSALAVGCLLRAEMLFFAAAVVGALLFVRIRDNFAGLRATQDFAPSTTRLVIESTIGRRHTLTNIGIGLCGILPLGAALASNEWRKSILNNGTTVLVTRSAQDPFIQGRFHGIWASLLRLIPNDPNVEAQTGAVCLICFLVLFYARHQLASRNLIAVPLVLVVLIGFYASVLLRNNTLPITGLFAAWPVLIVIFVFSQWTARPRVAVPHDPALAFVATTLVLFFAAVILTQYSVGGGLEWGGRFFMPAIALLAAVAASSSGVTWISEQRVALRVAVAVVAILPIALGLVGSRNLRAAEDLEPIFARLSPTFTVSSSPHFARIEWRSTHHTNFMFVPYDLDANTRLALRDDAIARALAVAQASGGTVAFISGKGESDPLPSNSCLPDGGDTELGGLRLDLLPASACG